MRLSVKFFAFYFVCGGLSVLAHAETVFNPNTSVRALGMGNAYLGVVQNADSLFYNPAGLARVSGLNWLIADIKVGANGMEVLETVNDIQGSSSFTSTMQNLYGDHVWVGGGGKTAVTFPYLGFAIYDNLDAGLDINNPMYPNFDVNVINDYGYTLGAAVPLLPILHIGTVLRYVQRTGSRLPFGPSYLGSLSFDSLVSDIQTKGHGYGLDMGLNLLIPGPVSPTLSFVWRNMGVTTYKADSATLSAPPNDQDEMSVGLALNVNLGLVSLNPAFDFRFLNRSDIQLGKKVHFGVELGLPMLDIRAGFNQGYYALGLGLNLGLIRVDAATYGEELGEYPGQREDRRYVVEFSMELGFDPTFGLFGGGGGSGKGGSGSKGGSSGGRGGGKRLKQRR